MIASQFLMQPSVQPVAFWACRVYPKYWPKYGVYPDFHACFIGNIEHSMGSENATNFPGYHRHVWGPCEPFDHFAYGMIKYCHLVKSSQESLGNWKTQKSQAGSTDRKSETGSLDETTAALPSRLGTPGYPACRGKSRPCWFRHRLLGSSTQSWPADGSSGLGCLSSLGISIFFLLMTSFCTVSFPVPSH